MKEENMTKEHHRIMQELRHGKDRAISKKALAVICQIPARRVEALIREMIVKHGCEIASSCEWPMGYFLIANTDELKRYRRQLGSRMRSLNERMMAVDRNLAREINRILQRELFLQEKL